jgi:hypothetical protein
MGSLPGEAGKVLIRIAYDVFMFRLYPQDGSFLYRERRLAGIPRAASSSSGDRDPAWIGMIVRN